MSKNIIIITLVLIILAALIFIFRGGPEPVETDQPFDPDESGVNINLYFVNREMMAEGTAAYEEMVQPVSRTVSFDQWNAEKAMMLLLEGPILAENETFDTSIPPAVILNGLRIEGGTAYPDFSQELGQAAGSATVITLREQIYRTLKQFPEITEVVIMIDGNSSEEILQP